MNENDQVVTDDFAKGFVDHRSIGLGTKAVTKFALHHTEGRFDVRPLMVALQKLFVLPQEKVEHFAVGLASLASFASVASTVRFKRDERHSARLTNGSGILRAQIALIGLVLSAPAGLLASPTELQTEYY